jgi:uncharacterized CHY-type Zn-finger protein
MKTMIGKCGIDCENCDAYRATIQNSDELRQKTADQWSKQFGVAIDPSSINCYGCQVSASDKLFSHCKVCGIRTCANEKNLQTCAACLEMVS